MPFVRARRVVLAATLAALLAAGYLGRQAVCGAVGRTLAADDEPAPADVVVLTLDAGAAGVIEAADLVATRAAPRVAVFSDLPTDAEREFARRGVPFERNADAAMRELQALGVRTVEEIPHPVDGTTSEGEALPAWARQHGYRTILVVTSREHAYRVGRVMRRAFASSGVRVLTRGARFSEFNPEAWCRSRDGLRMGIVESEKLFLDFLRHPLP
jgi:hypothetical protein